MKPENEPVYECFTVEGRQYRMNLETAVIEILGFDGVYKPSESPDVAITKTA